MPVHDNPTFEQQQHLGNVLYQRYKAWLAQSTEDSAAVPKERQYLVYTWLALSALGLHASVLYKEGRRLVAGKARGVAFEFRPGWMAHVFAYRRRAESAALIQHMFVNYVKSRSFSSTVLGAYRKIRFLQVRMRHMFNVRRAALLCTVYRMNLYEKELLDAVYPRFSQHTVMMRNSAFHLRSKPDVAAVTTSTMRSTHPALNGEHRNTICTSTVWRTVEIPRLLFRFKLSVVKESIDRRRQTHSEEVLRLWNAERHRPPKLRTVPPWTRSVPTQAEVQALYGKAVSLQNAHRHSLEEKLRQKFSSCLSRGKHGVDAGVKDVLVRLMQHEWGCLHSVSLSSELAFVRSGVSANIFSIDDWERSCLPPARQVCVHPPLRPSFYHSELQAGTLGVPTLNSTKEAAEVCVKAQPIRTEQNDEDAAKARKQKSKKGKLRKR